MKAVLLPVSKPLAGHRSCLSLKKATPNSIKAPVARQIRICAIESRKPRTVWPSAWSVSKTMATCKRGSRMLGRMTRYSRPKIRADLGLGCLDRWEEDRFDEPFKMGKRADDARRDINGQRRF